MAIQWSDDLATGVTDIDRQHQEIFRRINALLEAASRGAGRERIGETMSFLASYVVEHFAAEERSMEKSKYPGYPAHKKQHVAFLNDVRTLAGRYQTEGASLTLSLEVQRVVVGWLLHHIRKEDKALGAHLKRHAPELLAKV